MAALCNRAGHYIFALWFLSSSSSIFFSSPNLSGRRLDVCHTSAHGVALVHISNACLKCAARGSLEIRDTKNRHFGTIAHLSGCIFATRAHIDNRKKLVKQQYLSQMSLQYGELRPTCGWDLLASLGHPCKCQRVSCLGSITARQSSSGRQPNCGVEQRAPPLFGRVAITLGIGPHF